jgi:hypothetical protein
MSLYLSKVSNTKKTTDNIIVLHRINNKILHILIFYNSSSNTKQRPIYHPSATPPSNPQVVPNNNQYINPHSPPPNPELVLTHRQLVKFSNPKMGLPSAEGQPINRSVNGSGPSADGPDRLMGSNICLHSCICDFFLILNINNIWSCIIIFTCYIYYTLSNCMFVFIPALYLCLHHYSCN